MDSPYAEAADLYWDAGWRGVLPLPHRAKKNPPKGYTGSTGTDPAYPDIATWADDTEGPRNICLRLPAGVIGIDVDAYGDKAGAVTLAAAEAEWGPLPPTWRTTSRDDGTSGIRLYRAPEGLAWPGMVGPGIETVRRDHRYAVVWPSAHPEGGTYRWIAPEGVTSTAVPDPDALPMLPAAWIAGLTGGEAAHEVARNSLPEDAANLWIVGLPGATEAHLCARMAKAARQAAADLSGGASAHDTATAAAARILRLGSEGHRGAVAALTGLRAVFTDEVTAARRTAAGKTRRTPSEAAREWRDIVVSGANLVSADPPAQPTCDCDGGITAAIIDAASPAPPAADDPAPPAAPGAPTPTDSGLLDGASFILDAPARPPAIWGDGDQVGWMAGESCTLVGPPGVGKTTICGQLVRARLGLQPSFLGWPVVPTASRVLYLAMDRPQQIARSLRRQFTEADRDTLAERLRVWQGPPPQDVALNPTILTALARLADADTIVIDSIKDAAVGLTDDTVGAGYNRARQHALANGVEVIELHHIVKRGPNGAAPKQLADVYGSAWITAGAGSVILIWGQAGDPVVQLLHLKQPAEDIGPLTLLHDATTGTTTLDEERADLRSILVASSHHGLVAKAAAVHLFATDNPTDAEVAKARRKLDGLVKSGVAVKVKGSAEGGKSKANTWYAKGREPGAEAGYAAGYAEGYGDA